MRTWQKLGAIGALAAGLSFLGGCRYSEVAFDYHYDSYDYPRRRHYENYPRHRGDGYHYAPPARCEPIHGRGRNRGSGRGY